jgi:transposase
LCISTFVRNTLAGRVNASSQQPLHRQWLMAAWRHGGMAAAGLIDWVLISKYVDHLPLYRIEQIAARAGVTLARSTLADWVGRYGVALQPLADRLSALLRRRSLLHADEKFAWSKFSR